MKKQQLASIIIGLLLLVGLVSIIDIYAVTISLKNIILHWAILIPATYIIVFLLRSWRWKILLHGLNSKVKFSDTFWIVMVGYLINHLIPLRIGGEAVRIYLFNKKAGVSTSKAASSVMLVRVFDFIMLIISGIIVLLMLPPIQANLLNIIYRNILLGLLIIGSIIFISIFNRQLFIKIIGKIPLGRWKEKITTFLLDTTDNIQLFGRNRQSLIVTIAITIPIWILEFSMTFFTLYALNIYPSPILILFGAIIFELTFGLPAPPGYAGTLEGFFVAIYTGLNVGTPATLLAAAILNHTLTLLAIAIFGFLGFIVLTTSWKEIKKDLIL